MDYQIEGQPFALLRIQLDPGEKIKARQGAMGWMSPSLEMKSSLHGGFRKSFMRMMTGNTLFQTFYTALEVPGEIALCSSYPGQIIVIDLEADRPIIVQKGGFLACTKEVDSTIHFRKRLSSGIFAGEGFIMQKIKGEGKLFLQIEGTTVSYQLEEKEQLMIDPGHLAYMDESVTIQIKTLAGFNHLLLGPEHFIKTILTGPGQVTLQSHPLAKIKRMMKVNTAKNTKQQTM